MHWDLADKDADTKEIERVATEAVEQMEEGETLIWDRLGRSGRASHPTSQHYSPEAKATFNARGEGVAVECPPQLRLITSF